MLDILVPGLHELTALTVDLEAEDGPDDIDHAKVMALADLDVLELMQLGRQLKVIVSLHEEINFAHLVAFVIEFALLRLNAGLQVAGEPR